MFTRLFSRLAFAGTSLGRIPVHGATPREERAIKPLSRGTVRPSRPRRVRKSTRGYNSRNRHRKRGWNPRGGFSRVQGDPVRVRRRNFLALCGSRVFVCSCAPGSESSPRSRAQQLARLLEDVHRCPRVSPARQLCEFSARTRDWRIESTCDGDATRPDPIFTFSRFPELMDTFPPNLSGSA